MIHSMLSDLYCIVFGFRTSKLFSFRGKKESKDKIFPSLFLSWKQWCGYIWALKSPYQLSMSLDQLAV